MNPEAGQSSVDTDNTVEDFRGRSFTQSESGLYVPGGKSSSHEEPQVSSQNEVDLSQYNEQLFRSKDEVIKKWKETGETTPPLVTAVAKNPTELQTDITTSQQEDDTVTQPQTVIGTPQQGADTTPQPKVDVVTSTEEQKGEDPLKYRKALNSVSNADRTLIAEDKKRRERGEGVTTIMEDDEAKRYEETLQDIERRNQYPNLSKLDQSLMRDDAERIKRGESVTTIMEDDEAKRYEETLQDIERRNQYPNLSKLDQSLMRDDAERIKRGESVTTIMEDDEAKRYEETLQDIERRNQYPNLSKLDQSLMRDDAERIKRGESVTTIMEDDEAKRYEEALQQETVQVETPSEETTRAETSEEATRAETPQERLTRLNMMIKELEDKEKNGPLTYEEYIKYRDLRLERDKLSETLNKQEKAEAEKRKKKNRWIKIIAGVAGAGIALATPAVSTAALIAITFGGRYIGKGLNKWGEHLRSKARDIEYQLKDGMTPEQIEELEKKQRRNKWWGERLSEISSVLIGGTAGYGIGKALQNVIEMVKSLQSQAPTTPEQPPADNAGDLRGDINQSSGIGGGESSTNTVENVVEATVTENTNTSTSWFNEGQQWWDTSKYGWNPRKYGWNSSNLALEGSPYADLQGSLLKSLSSKVPESVFYKPGALDLLHRALATLYEQGAGSVNTISETLAQGLQALP